MHQTRKITPIDCSACSRLRRHERTLRTGSSGGREQGTWHGRRAGLVQAGRWCRRPGRRLGRLAKNQQMRAGDSRGSTVMRPSETPIVGRTAAAAARAPAAASGLRPPS
eukprot:38911-Chlamydomonas_euryale.AAC.10